MMHLPTGRGCGQRAACSAHGRLASAPRNPVSFAPSHRPFCRTAKNLAG